MTPEVKGEYITRSILGGIQELLRMAERSDTYGYANKSRKEIRLTPEVDYYLRSFAESLDRWGDTSTSINRTMRGWRVVIAEATEEYRRGAIMLSMEYEGEEIRFNLDVGSMLYDQPPSINYANYDDADAEAAEAALLDSLNHIHTPKPPPTPKGCPMPISRKRRIDKP